MGHDENLTTARDVVKLGAAAMRYPVFRRIVRRRMFACTGTTGSLMRPKTFKWENTNALLWSGSRGADSNTSRSTSNNTSDNTSRSTSASNNDGPGGDDDSVRMCAFDGVKTGWVPNAHGQRIHACLLSHAGLDVAVPSSAAPSASSSRDRDRDRAAPTASTTSTSTPVSMLRTCGGGRRSVLVCVLGSPRKPLRFVDTFALVAWASRTAAVTAAVSIRHGQLIADAHDAWPWVTLRVTQHMGGRLAV